MKHIYKAQNLTNKRKTINTKKYCNDEDVKKTKFELETIN